MKPFLGRSLGVLGVSLLFLAGCAGERPYRDPVTYEFEGNAPAPAAQAEWERLQKEAQEASQKIRAWEEKHLW